APSASNGQPWHFTVIQNQELLRHINDTVREQLAKSDVEWMRNSGLNPDFQATYNAPTLIIVSGRKTGMAWQADCAFAMENMMLAAESLGIGSVCLGMVKFIFDQNNVMEKLQMPEGYEPFYGIVFGYKPDDKTIEAPKRNMDVVNYIR
ncbi:MAG TPA: nitroreductase family protein, partial [Anaerovoracaceae bacterium]|nr:nitroreductase family protein [Anaerovoracaceae bacterium]